ncbi:hypothetical protein GCM10011608_10230 [Micromonospora sonchi]|uniref:Uncharacterized protein n=1 Tax=Micromonospora sonchi TaxID=1763543 RepID=A0A917TLF5_9ACTN|nr:hypothetical protein [Micromonospora sonchi]GGM27430.1 hypothetical protein GCM10011608_10230 [Micromonospora sonchi]
MFNVGIGFGLVIIGITAQYLIAKRLKHQKVSKVFSWIAWGAALLGGVGMSSEFGNAVGISSGGAAIASLAALMFIVVDIADRRPDWPAFILIVLAPTLMRITGGGLGSAYDALLMPIDGIITGLRAFLGM